jgi:adhesin transport system outer membrane protein
MTKLGCVLALATALFAPLALAQVAQPMTLDQAIRAAAMTNPSVRVAEASRESLAYRQESAEWQRWPQLGAEYGQTDTGIQPGTVRLDQPIFTFGRISSEIDAARARTEGGEQLVQETRLDIGLQAGNAFLELSRMEERAVAAAENVAAHEKLFDMIQRRTEAEVSSEADERLAAARLAQARAEREQFMGAANRARSQLSALTGQPIGMVVYPKEVAIPYASEADVFAHARENSPILKRYDKEALAAAGDAKAARGGVMPQLVLRGEYTNATSASYDTWDTRALAVVSFQPGAGLAAASNVNAARAKERQARFAQDKALLDIQDRSRAAWIDYVSYRAQADLLRDQSIAANDVVESYIRQYATGRKTWFEVMNSQRDLAVARYSSVDARYASYLAAIRAKAVAGELLSGP